MANKFEKTVYFKTNLKFWNNINSYFGSLKHYDIYNLKNNILIKNNLVRFIIIPFYCKSSNFLKTKGMEAKLLFSMLLLMLSSSFSAQELTLSLSQHPNKQAIIIAIHGIRKDTLGTMLLDQNGKGSLNFKNKQPQAGLVNLTIKDKAYLSYDFVLSPSESPKLICDMEYVYTQNTRILDSPENDSLNRWFDDMEIYKKKINIIQELGTLCKPKTAFLNLIENEKIKTLDQLQKLTDTITQSTLFAGKYMQFKMAQEEKLAKVWEGNEQRKVAQNYFTKIDFDALYGSSLWFSIINSCIEAYSKEGPFYETFGADVVSNLKQIKNEQVYQDLLDAAISVTEKFAWNKDEEAIVNFIVKDNRIKNPQGKLLKIIQSHKTSVGKKAFNLELSQTLETKNKTIILKTDQLKMKFGLLLFYQSGCGHCETFIEGLQKNYDRLSSLGVRIIAISADVDQTEFKNKAVSFKWKDTYCDFKGTNGINFTNYGVIGTPTIFLLDNKGIVLEKIATIDQLLAWMEKK